jgi:hypothetical protein
MAGFRSLSGLVVLAPVPVSGGAGFGLALGVQFWRLRL